MNPSSVPAISVLVCTRNRPEDLENCVSTILANRFRDFELIVVDQGDGDDVGRYLASLTDDRIRHIPTRTRGLARARNIALHSARAELVAFTDDDCFIDPDWIGSIVEEFQANPEVAGLFGRVLPYGDHFSEGLFCHCLIDNPEPGCISSPAPPHKHLGHGNNMSFRKDLFRKVGLYNPEMGAGTRMKSGEDTDLTYRALRQGFCLKYSPVPLVYHNNWKDLDSADRLDLGYVYGFVMVFGKFALLGDRVARNCLRERLGGLVQDVRDCWRYRNRRKFFNTLKKFVHYAMGIVPAIRFRIKGDLPWETPDPIGS